MLNRVLKGLPMMVHMTWPSHSKTSLKVNLYKGYYYLCFVSSTKKILWAEKNRIEGYPITWLILTHTGSCVINVNGCRVIKCHMGGTHTGHILHSGWRLSQITCVILGHSPKQSSLAREIRWEVGRQLPNNSRDKLDLVDSYHN